MSFTTAKRLRDEECDVAVSKVTREEPGFVNGLIQDIPPEWRGIPFVDLPFHPQSEYMDPLIPEHFKDSWAYGNMKTGYRSPRCLFAPNWEQFEAVSTCTNDGRVETVSDLITLEKVDRPDLLPEESKEAPFSNE